MQIADTLAGKTKFLEWKSRFIVTTVGVGKYYKKLCWVIQDSFHLPTMKRKEKPEPAKPPPVITWLQFSHYLYCNHIVQSMNYQAWQVIKFFINFYFTNFSSGRRYSSSSSLSSVCCLASRQASGALASSTVYAPDATRGTGGTGGSGQSVYCWV